MKKKLFYLLSVVMLSSGLSSCLDDTSDASMSGSAFAVIKQVDNVASPTMWVENGLILTWEGMEYNVGHAMIIDYYVELGNQSNGVVTAEAKNIKVTEEFPLSSQKSITIGAVDTLVQNTDNMFESLARKGSSITNSFLDDKWLFLTKALIKEGQIMDLEFYYDAGEGMQHTSTGTPLPDGVIVVDVKLNIRGQGDGTAKPQDKYFVVDMSNLRSEIFKNTKESTQCKIWFRYYDKSKSNTKPSYVQNVGGLIHEVSN